MLSLLFRLHLITVPKKKGYMRHIVMFNIFLHPSLWWREFSLFLSACTSWWMTALWHEAVVTQTVFVSRNSHHYFWSTYKIRSNETLNYSSFMLWSHYFQAVLTPKITPVILFRRYGFASSLIDPDLFASESQSDWTLTCEKAILNVQWFNVQPIWKEGCV